MSYESDGAGARASRGLFTWAPAALTVVLVGYLLAHGQFAFDFRHAYVLAGSRILHGANPYAWNLRQIYDQSAFVYPAAAGLLFVPAALLPAWFGAPLFTALCIACAAGTLRVLQVQDRRLYGIVMLWAPVVAGWQSANLTLPLVFALALVWRYRDRPIVSGLIAGAMLSLKPFLWPVALWMLATRRGRAAAWCAAGALVLNLVAWSVVGFSRFGQFLSIASRVTDALYRHSYSVMGLVANAGASRPIAEALLIVASVALVVGGVLAGRRGDWVSFTLCVVLALIASPLVDIHYFALLIVPLAIARPRLSVEWVAPLALWLCPESPTAGWQAGLAWLIVALLVYRLTLMRVASRRLEESAIAELIIQPGWLPAQKMP